MEDKLNIAEIFCESATNLIKGALQGISYDSTVLCTIIDDSKKDDGVYTVQSSSAKFEAYSLNTNYHKNDNVYVQIPNGDWNEQKMIISKKADKKSQQPLTYIAPFDQFVNISNNLIKTEVKGNLIANAKDNEDYEYKSEELLWSWTSSENDPPLMDYTRLGLSADFQSWLEEDTFFGRYGLKLKVYGYRKSVTAAADAENKTEDEAVMYELELNEKDMYGNPYDYPTYFTQEKLFDITEIYCIHKMELFFYEKPDTFFLKDGITPLDYEDFLGNYINPNLFVRDIQVAVGYDVSEFEDEMLLLYTFNTETYESTQTDEQNTKQIHVRWIHEDDNGNYVSIDGDNAKDLDYTLTFYRYELGRGSADDYSGVYWKELSTHIHSAENNSYVNKYGAECGKVPADKQPGNLDTWFIPDTSLQTEQIKAILRFNNKTYRSKILEFKNNKDVKSKATLEALEALTIRCMDNSYGNYYIYALGNKLLNEADASTTREFRAYFDLDFATKVEAELNPLVEAEEVEWIIPKDNTMIIIDEGYRAPDKTDLDGYHFIWKGDLSQPVTSDNCFKIDYRIGSYFSQYKGNNTIQLNITKGGVKYSASKTLSFGPAGTSGIDHTLVLDFDKNVNALTAGDTTPITVTARLYNFQNEEIDISNRAIEWAWKGYISAQTAQMKYEADTTNNNKVNIWLLSKSIKPDKTNYSILQCTLKKWSSSQQNGWGDYDLVAYLPIPIRSSADYRHIIGPTTIIYNSDGIADSFYRDAYALRKNDGTDFYGKWDIFSGRTKPYIYTQEIIFDAEEKYYVLDETTQTYILADPVPTEDTFSEGSYYIQIASDDDDSTFIPTIQQAQTKTADGTQIVGYFLTPSNLYTESACNQLCVCGYNDTKTKILWSQPLLILKNRWPSAMLNNWDGQLKIDEENNTILAARIAAGRKEKDNTYTGVIMGDWNDGQTENNKLVKHTGLAGYHYGEMSFAFVNDGTAFIGKKGHGRIQFNGNQGTITSGNYSNTSGMKIDLEEGHIDAYNFKLTSNNLLLDSTNSGTYFQIDSNKALLVNNKIELNDVNGKQYPLICIGDSDYYLQSLNYALSPDKAGVKINLKDGRINAYNLKISANGLLIDTNGPDFEIYDTSGKNYIKFNEDTLNIQVVDNIMIGSGSNYIEIPNEGQIEINATAGVHLGSTDYFIDIQTEKDENNQDVSKVAIKSDNFNLTVNQLEIDSETPSFYIGNANKYINNPTDCIYFNNGNLILKATTGITLGSGDNYLTLSDNKISLQSNAFILETDKLKINSTTTTFYIGNTASYIAADTETSVATENCIYFNAGSLILKAKTGITLGVDKTSHIKVNNGTIDIKANVFDLSTANEKLIINSNATEEAYYFKVANEDESNIISLTANGILTIKADNNVTLGSGENSLTLSSSGGLALKTTNFTLTASTTTGDTTNTITFTSDSDKNPLTIGDKFSVAWDGTITATNANLTGEINADSGRIGYWNIQTGDAVNYTGTYSRLWTAGGDYITSLYSEYPHTSASYRFVIVPGKTASSDGLIEGTPTFYIRKDGYLYATSGQIGPFAMNSDSLSYSDKAGNSMTISQYSIKNTGRIETTAVITTGLTCTDSTLLPKASEILIKEDTGTVTLKEWLDQQKLYAILA